MRFGSKRWFSIVVGLAVVALIVASCTGPEGLGGAGRTAQGPAGAQDRRDQTDQTDQTDRQGLKDRLKGAQGTGSGRGFPRPR